MKRPVALVMMIALAAVLASPGNAAGARRHVYHLSGASTQAYFSTCGDVGEGEICSMTFLYASHERPISSLLEGGVGACVFVEHDVGYRSGPYGIRPTTVQWGFGCGSTRITIPRSLKRAWLIGTVDTKLCRYTSPMTCEPAGPIHIDLRWEGTGALEAMKPQTVKYADDDNGLPCLYHQSPWATRPATASGTISEFGPLGANLPDAVTLLRSGSTYVGQDAISCID